ncbi:hypothetical protein [Mesorhizobium sp. A623]
MDTITTVNAPASEWATNIAILETGLYGRESVSTVRNSVGLTDFGNSEEIENTTRKLQTACADFGFSIDTEVMLESLRFDQWSAGVLKRELEIVRADIRCMNAIGGNDWPDSLRARLAIYRQYRGFDAYETMAA